MRSFTTEEAALVRGPSTPLADMIEGFCLAQTQLSPRTLDGYRANLRTFARWLGPTARTRDLELDSCDRYVSDLRRRSPHSARYSAATLKAFASWLAQRGYLALEGRSVLLHLRIPRTPRTGRSAFADADIAVILRTLERTTHRTRARDRALVLLMLATGIRLNEARELALEDVHIERPVERSYIVVRAETSKGRTTRQVRLDPLAAAAVHEYVVDWRPDRTGPLFLTEEGRPFTIAGMTTYLGRLRDRMEQAGVKGFMAHRLRHTWATLYHRTHAGTLYDLQREGGWRDLEMPRRYTHDRPFEELQKLPTALSAWMRRAG